MEPAVSKTPVTSIVTLIALIIFCAALAMSIASYPPGFTPLENWMSDLGNPRLNPSGSGYFNAACMITGLFLVVFYLGLYRWRDADRVKTGMLTAAQAAGVFSGIALAGVGYFPETFEPHHFIVSALFFLSSTLAILLTTVALREHPGTGKATILAGYLAVATGIVFAAQMVAFPSVTIIEWISVFSMLLWAALMSLDMIRARDR